MDTNGHGSNDLNERAKRTRSTAEVAAASSVVGGGLTLPVPAAPTVDPNTLLAAAIASQDPSTLAVFATAIAQMNSNSTNQNAGGATQAPSPRKKEDNNNNNNSGGGGSTTAGTLSSTAPVSSLLPPIPAAAAVQQPSAFALQAAVPVQQPAAFPQQQQQQQQQHAGLSTLQTQLAALLGVATAAPAVPTVASSVDTTTQQQHQHNHHRHHHHHHKVQRTGAGPQHQHAFHPVVPTSTHHSTSSNNTPPPAQQMQQLVSKPRVKAPHASAAPTPVPLTSMQTWTLSQLENHAKLYTQMGQPVPQSVSLVLEGARRKEQKKNAKREANRKSASSSRARKKALMEEMAELNVRLRRQALILALLPDLVIVIDPQGVISFVSAQVQNVLRHDVDDLVGARMTDLLVPASKTKLQQLVKQLVASSSEIVGPSPSDASLAVAAPPPKATKANMAMATTKQGAMKKQDNDAVGNDMGPPGGAADADSTMADAVNGPTDPSFPLPEVKFKKKNSLTSDENDNSDGSRSKEPSSLTASAEIDNSDNSANSGKDRRAVPPAILPRSPTGSSLGNSGSDEGGDDQPPKGKKASEKAEVKGDGRGDNHKAAPGRHSSDTSNSSSLSTTAKKLQKANANLERNVRWHNKKMKAGQIANNATARLSSLQHRSESSSSEGDDSGYRESNDSREETSSSTSDSDDTTGRRKPLAPTCNICLIRKDLTTIWCEVTSSIRRKEQAQDSTEESMSVDAKSTSATKTATNKEQSSEEATTTAESTEGSTEGSVELLLCLRPIRDGDEKVDEKLRFEPDPSRRVVSESSSGLGSGEASGSTGPSSDENPTTRRSLKSSKKRGALSTKSDSPSKRRRKQGVAKPQGAGGKADGVAASTEAVESFMLMNRN